MDITTARKGRGKEGGGGAERKFCTGIQNVIHSLLPRWGQYVDVIIGF